MDRPGDIEHGRAKVEPVWTARGTVPAHLWHGAMNDAAEAGRSIARLEAQLAGAVEDRDALAAYVAWRWNPVGDAPIVLDDLRALMTRLGYPIGGQA